MSVYDYVPLYVKLKEKLEDRIVEENWQIGTKIPSERELCEIYGVSRITVRKAIEELTLQGRLKKIHGKGTYYVGETITQSLGNLYSFSGEMERQGKISSTKLVIRKVLDAGEKIARKLGIEEDDKVIYIERLRCSGQTPLMVEKTYFKHDGYEFLLDLDLNKVQLYKTLRNDYDIELDKATESFKACLLNEVECEQLNSPKHQFGLLIKRTTYSKGEIITYSTIVSKGDTFEFTVDLTL